MALAILKKQSDVLMETAGKAFFMPRINAIALISVDTELLSTARATIMAVVLSTAGVGRMIGALTDGALWTGAGRAVAAVSVPAT